MVTKSELKEKAIVSLDILIGSISVIPENIEELETRLNSLMISQTIVSKLEKCTAKNQRTITLFAPIGSKAIEDQIQLFQFNEPLIAHLEYSSKVVDPDSPYENQKINVTLLYDGLVYLAAFQPTKPLFNLLRHAAHLQKWLFDLLSKETSWKTSQTSKEPFPPLIDLYILEEPPAGAKGDWIQLVSSGGGNATLWTVKQKDESVQEAIVTEIRLLYIAWLEELCRHYASAQMLNALLISENRRAGATIGHIVDETLGFYDIPFWHIVKRFQRSRSLGKQLAQIYALMPNVEKTENDYATIVGKLSNLNPADDLGKAFTAMFSNRLPTRQQTVFTRSVNETLREDLSEIRAQLNYQVLLLSAFITFIAVIIAAFIK